MPLDLPPDEAATLRRGDGPAVQIDLIQTMIFHAAVAALRLGVFGALERGPRELGALAGELAVDEANLRALLRLLVTGGYLAEGPDGYERTPAGAWLAGPDDGFGAVLDFWHSLIGELWQGLEETVRTGRPQRDFYAWLQERPDVLTRFQGIQLRIAEWVEKEVLELAALPGEPARLLDLGGGHARYSLAYCRSHPGLSATVLDLPEALEPGRAAVEAEGLTGRFAFVPGDLRTAELPGGQDVVLLFNVLHGFPALTARTLVGRAVGALRPGGRLILMETLTDPVGSVLEEGFTRGFDLNLIHTQGGRLHPVETIAGWMVEAGCSPPARHDLTRSATLSLLVADREG
ncbi:SAM-dependent methyltransferase [Planobispora rosea]|uniref:SAM-dependent methyltransferase n=1 Tax=Planobispora rosea TaxID=35762 RepID=A0A8J3S2X2_PLARO|nr:methyltransferase [Planobispora rosea]GGS89670.1 SAM-dependent methyltransferase [Planobispora rosea]GIH86752.1 SAM-dependent methyltransferase [Planobispora rosea]